MTEEKKRAYRRYSRELKEEVCRLALSNTMKHKELAQKFDLDPSLITKWVKSHEQEGSEAFRGRGNRRLLEAENQRLRKENQVLKEEREILKKATAYFAKHLV